MANHSDHELAILAYYTLLRYEPNPDRREIWKQSLRDFFVYEVPERNPLQVAVMSSALDDADIPLAAHTLLEMPSDWREWLTDNSHRRDVEVDPQEDRHENLQFTTVLPYDEIATMMWNRNPYQISTGSSGKTIIAPWPYLLPYWMMRYYGAIQ